MTHLILVKHSLAPEDRSLPQDRWPLSEEGRLLCRPLAEALSIYRPARILTSTYTRAAETGAALAELLGLPCETAAGLHEHERRFEPSDEDFEAGMRHFFTEPDLRVYGLESAREAEDRFHGAVDRLLAVHPNETLIIVAHGTVISLYLEKIAKLDARETWQRLRRPAFVALSRPAFEIVELVEQIRLREDASKPRL